MQTVYWRRLRELDAASFAKAAVECGQVCNALEKAGKIGLEGIPPAKGPVFTESKIEFRGKPGVEPFVLRRVSLGREREGKVLEFCKTHMMPYEIAVIACLQILKRHFGDEFTIEVDEKSDAIWMTASEAILETLGWKPE